MGRRLFARRSSGDGGKVNVVFFEELFQGSSSIHHPGDVAAAELKGTFHRVAILRGITSPFGLVELIATGKVPFLRAEDTSLEIADAGLKDADEIEKLDTICAFGVQREWILLLGDMFFNLDLLLLLLLLLLFLLLVCNASVSGLALALCVLFLASGGAIHGRVGLRVCEERVKRKVGDDDEQDDDRHRNHDIRCVYP